MADVSKAAFLKKMKAQAKGSFKRARKAEPRARGIQLPGGIRNGIAKLSQVKFKETKDGDPMLQLDAIVVSPEEHEGHKAIFSWWLNESEYATVEENLEQLCGDCKTIGIDTDEMDEDDLLAALEEACEEGLEILFNTSQNKNGNVRCYLAGLPEGEDEEEENPKRGNKSSNKKSKEEEEPEEEEEEESEEEESEEEEDFIPSKGEVYGLTVKKGRKKVKISFVIDKVNKKDETVDGHNEEDEDETYEDIPFSDLESADEE